MNSGPIEPDSTTTVQDDLRLIVSGNFSQDALGPDRYRDILARVAAAPRTYLDAFRAHVHAATDEKRLSSLHLPWFLTVLARTDKAAARDGARELLPAYEKAVREARGAGEGRRRAAPAKAPVEQRESRVSDEEKMVDRLETRVAELQRILQS